MAFSDDGHGVAIFDAATQSLSGHRNIRKAVWTGFTAAIDALEIDHNTNKEYFYAQAGATAGSIEIVALSGAWVNDLTLKTISAGKLYVYYE